LEAREMEPAFAKFEKGLSLKSDFSDLSHSLEFYGICNRCQ
jgi:Fe2+ or Zn2+ uptake regulation protein